MTADENLSETQIIERVEARMEQRESRTPHSRLIEDIGFIVGIVQAMLYGTLEALRHSGVVFGKCEAETGFPWITVIIFIGCVLPKTVGRATTGKIWEFAAGRLGAKS
jgi:hypothetical protein